MMTAAQQGQLAPFGFLNPVLSKLYRTGACHRSLARPRTAGLDLSLPGHNG